MDEEITSVSVVREKRIQQPPSRLAYPQLGNPTENVQIDRKLNIERPQTNRNAPSVKSVQSSTSTRIMQNKLETQKKIAALEKEIEEASEHVADLMVDLNHARKELTYYKGEKADEESKKAIRKAEVKIFDLEAQITKGERKLNRLKASFERRRKLIEDESEIINNIIIEEDFNYEKCEQDHEERSTFEEENEKHNRVKNWIENGEKTDHDDISTSFSHTHQRNQHESEPLSDIFEKFATALTRAIQNQQQNTLVVMRSTDSDLPYFDGSAEDWLIFKNEFERTSKILDNSQKMVRLRSHLKDKAKFAVNHLLANPDNVNKIMKTLEQAFGNPEKIITTLIEKAKCVKAPDLNRPETIVGFGTAVDALVTNVISFQLEEYMNNIQLLNELVDKLPKILQREWHKFAMQSQQKKNLQMFQSWIQDEVNTAYQQIKPEPVQERFAEIRKMKNQGIHTAKEKKRNFCHNCNIENHIITSCRKFMKLPISEKRKKVRENGLCYKCLEKGHRSADCPEKQVCGLDSCTNIHHRLLHPPSMNKENSRKDKKPSEFNSDSSDVLKAVASAGNGFIPIIPVKVTGPRKTKTVLAFLDTGASFTMIKSDIANEIGLSGNVKPLSFNVFGNAVRINNDSRMVDLTVEGVLRNSNRYLIKNVRTIKNLEVPSSKLDFDDIREKFVYLNGARVKSIPDKRPQMIIGYDNYRLFCPLQTIEDPNENGPSAHLCRLGWYLSGVTEREYCYFACESGQTETDQHLHTLIQNFFQIENSDDKNCVTPSSSKEDQRSTWKKRIIDEVYPGKDGQVRVVNVRVTFSKKDKEPITRIYRRPVVKSSL